MIKLAYQSVYSLHTAKENWYNCSWKMTVKKQGSYPKIRSCRKNNRENLSSNININCSTPSHNACLG